MEAITTALTSAFTTVQTQAESLISTGLPFALAIGGAVLAVGIGWKVFKKFTK